MRETDERSACRREIAVGCEREKRSLTNEQMKVTEHKVREERIGRDRQVDEVAAYFSLFF